MGQEMNEPDILVEGSYNQNDVVNFKQKYPGYLISDLFEDQLRELFEITSPNLVNSEAEYMKFRAERGGKHPELKGSWVAYTWLKMVLHILNEADYFQVRTNRNKNLLSEEESNLLQQYTVGIAGLSVGNSIARALAYGSVCGKLVLADKDIFSLSNMNRVNIGMADLGKQKTYVTARQIYEINPYARIHEMPKGISVDNLDEFFISDKFIAFDEIDDFEMKVRLRIAAKEKKAVVIMMTSLGDNVLVDVERHDKHQVAPFNGKADSVIGDILSGQLSDSDKKRYAVQLIGIENVPTKALQSLGQMGKTLVGRPQLFSSISISAGLASFIVRQIGLADLSSGRYLLSVSDIFKLGRSDLDMSPAREEILKKLTASNA